MVKTETESSTEEPEVHGKEEDNPQSSATAKGNRGKKEEEVDSDVDDDIPQAKIIFNFASSMCPVTKDTRVSTLKALVYDSKAYVAEMEKLRRQALAKRKSEEVDDTRDTKRMKIAENWKCVACGRMNPDDESKCLAEGCGKYRKAEKIQCWGNIFKPKKQSWICEVCSCHNDNEMYKSACPSCKTARPGSTSSPQSSVPPAGGITSAVPTSSGMGQITPGGFSFGNSTTSSAVGFTFGTPATNISNSSGGFTFGNAAVPASSSGFTFGNATVPASSSMTITFGANPNDVV